MILRSLPSENLSPHLFHLQPILVCFAAWSFCTFETNISVDFNWLVSRCSFGAKLPVPSLDKRRGLRGEVRRPVSFSHRMKKLVEIKQKMILERVQLRVAIREVTLIANQDQKIIFKGKNHIQETKGAGNLRVNSASLYIVLSQKMKGHHRE